MVEQRTLNPFVVGSIPSRSTITGKVHFSVAQLVERVTVNH